LFYQYIGSDHAGQATTAKLQQNSIPLVDTTGSTTMSEWNAQQDFTPFSSFLSQYPYLQGVLVLMLLFGARCKMRTMMRTCPVRDGVMARAFRPPADGIVFFKQWSDDTIPAAIDFIWGVVIHTADLVGHRCAHAS
jgi:hypothetical protein